MDDLISRQVAIDDAHRQIWYRMNLSMRERIDEWLKKLPSAQPEIIRCEDCEFGRRDVFDRGMWCTRHPEYDVNEDDFCNRAKPREDTE